MLDLDVVQRQRIDSAWKMFGEEGIVLEDIFLSDEIIDRLAGQRVALDSFSTERLLSILPFSEEVFVHVCPMCINKGNFSIFKGLVDSGLITPIFTSSYHRYSQEVIDVIATKPHISIYEYSLYKTVILAGESTEGICGHCVDNRVAEISKLVARRRNAPLFRKYLQTTVENIYPFIAPDFEILDELERCFRALDLAQCRQVVDMSWAIRSVRNAQLFGSPLLLSDDRIDLSVHGDMVELAELRRIGLELHEFISDGLGLRIPLNMPMKDYVDLVKEIRPDLRSINTKLTKSGDTGAGETSMREVFNKIQDVNREVERILRSKRYLFLEAAVSVISNNKALLTSSLVSAGLGLGGSLIGCGAALSAGVAVDQLKKKGKLPANASAVKLGEAIKRDLEPTLKKVVAAYVGSSVVPLQVIAVRQKVESKKATGLSTVNPQVPGSSPGRGARKIKEA